MEEEEEEEEGEEEEEEEECVRSSKEMVGGQEIMRRMPHWGRQVISGLAAIWEGKGRRIIVIYYSPGD